MRTLFIIPLVLMSLVSLPSWNANYKKGVAAGKIGKHHAALGDFQKIEKHMTPSEIIKARNLPVGCIV